MEILRKKISQLNHFLPISPITVSLSATDKTDICLKLPNIVNITPHLTKIKPLLDPLRYWSKLENWVKYYFSDDKLRRGGKIMKVMYQNIIKPLCQFQEWPFSLTVKLPSGMQLASYIGMLTLEYCPFPDSSFLVVRIWGDSMWRLT